MARKVIVDGYNVIKRDPGLRRFEKQGLIHAREALISKLQNSPTFRNDSITIVFDGWDSGNETETIERLGRIVIMYSRHGKKADEVIKELASVSGRTSEVLVITHDFEIRDSVVSSGGAVAGMVRKPPVARNQNNEDEPGYKDRAKKKGNPRKLPKRKRQNKPVDLSW